MRHSCPVLLGQYPTSREEVRQARELIARLAVTASPRWIAQRTVKFLTGHYFIVDMKAPVAEQVGKDWTNELSDFPEWAIDRAFAFWIGRENTKRAKKPLPGDIAQRAVVEYGIVRTAEINCNQFDKYGDQPPTFLRK